jgi:hypothetical protein
VDPVRASRWAAVSVLALAVAGCGQVVPGTPAPDPGAARQAADEMLKQGMDALGKYVQESVEFRGTLYRYATVNDNQSGEEVNVSSLGDPPARITKIRVPAHDGYDYDIFHPAKSTLDYVRLGPQYAKLEPTKWLSMPTFSASGFSCAVPGLQTLCKLSAAIDATAKAGPSGLTTTASRLADGGTEVRTAVTLKSFLDATVIPIPDDVANNIQPDMMGALIPTQLVLNSDGTLQKIEVTGEVAGHSGGKMKLQVGYEAKGRPGQEDFPPIPQAAELTALPDKATVDNFWAQLRQIRY